MPPTQIVLLLLLLLLAEPVAVACPDAPTGYAGRPLTEALESLQALGLHLVYSSDLVRPEMIVSTEPLGASLREILNELVIPYGLQVREGPEDTLLIVRTPEGSTGRLEGRVAAESDGQPIPLARVRVLGTGLEAAASANGRFRVVGIPAGDYPLQVRLAGLAPQSFDAVRVRARAVSRVRLALRTSPAILERITVTPGQDPTQSGGLEAPRSLRTEQMEALPRLGDDLMRVVSWLPGTAAGDRSAWFSVRGGEKDEVLVLLDGLEIEQPFHLTDFLSFSGIIDSKAIGSAELLTGGFPAEYGDRLSGALELTSIDPPGDGRLSLGTSTVNASILAAGRMGAGSGRWLASGRAWSPDAVVDLVSTGGEELHPAYFDLFGKVETQLDGGTIVSGHLLAAVDGVDFVGDGGRSGAEAGSNSDYAWLTFRTPWTGRLFSQTLTSLAQIDRNRVGFSNEPGEGTASVRDARFSNVYGLKQDWSFRASSRALLKWGFDARHRAARYDYASHAERTDLLLGTGGAPVVTDRRVILQRAADSAGVYVAGRLQPGGPLTLEVGARWDAQSHTGESELSPRFNVVYALGDRSALRAGWGFFDQSQRVTELQVEDGVTRFFPAERAQHRVLSLEHTSPSGIYFRGDAYLKEMTRLEPRFENLFNPIVLFPEAESDRVRIAPDRAEAKGVELFLRADGGPRVSWWAAYALSSVRDRIDGNWIARSWDQRHTFTAGVDLHDNDRWIIGFASVYHTGWPTTAVTATAVTNPDGSQSVFPVIGPRNGERYPAFHRLDLRVSRRVAVSRGDLRFYLEVTNLYDHRNVCCVEEFRFVPQPDDSVAVDRKVDTWLQHTPTVGFVWEQGF